MWFCAAFAYDRRMASKLTPLRAIRAAIKAAGGPTALARQLSARGRVIRSAQVIQGWVTTRRVPADHCPDVEAITGVRCEDLRPDVNWSVLRGCTCPDKQAA